VATPRGSQGTLPVEFTSDLNFKYTPAFLPGLTLRADVFNVFDRQSAEAIEERFNTRGGTRLSTSNVVQTYSTPRTVKLTIAYDKKF
jgi:outer membrane receptor protein involved in Fe transport